MLSSQPALLPNSPSLYHLCPTLSLPWKMLMPAITWSGVTNPSLTCVCSQHLSSERSGSAVAVSTLGLLFCPSVLHYMPGPVLQLSAWHLSQGSVTLMSWMVQPFFLVKQARSQLLPAVLCHHCFRGHLGSSFLYLIILF